MSRGTAFPTTGEDRWTCTSAQSDQSSQDTSGSPRIQLPQVDSEDSDQTARMRRLIWVITGRTCSLTDVITRARSDAAERSEWSGSTLFVTHPVVLRLLTELFNRYKCTNTSVCVLVQCSSAVDFDDISRYVIDDAEKLSVILGSSNPCLLWAPYETIVLSDYGIFIIDHRK